MENEASENKCKVTLRFFGLYWKSIVLILVPILSGLIFVLGGTEPKFRCLYVFVVTAMYWVTECIPIGITSLIPVALLPILKVIPTDLAVRQFMNDTNVLLVTAIMIAITIEYCNLHTRVAMFVLLLIGCSPRKLNFGIFLMTMFVSMWITNTAAAAMMGSIVTAFLQELEKNGVGRMFDEEDMGDGEIRKTPTKTTLCYFLGISYAASIGGIGTLIGTGTNLTYKRLFEDNFHCAEETSFFGWMAVFVPVMLICSLFTWFWLQLLYMGLFRPNSVEGKECKEIADQKQMLNDIMKAKYKELGKITWHESVVGILFVLGVFLWMFRSPVVFEGWQHKAHIQAKDGSVGVLIMTLYFMIPSKLNFVYNFIKTKRWQEDTSACITWPVLVKKFPWNIMLLLGGGFALAKAGNVSGMFKMIADKLESLSELDKFGILFIVATIASVMTEFSSNVAIANILLPVLAEMAKNIKVSPVYLMMPVAVVCSYSFMLPVGTPPNALVAGMANIPTPALMKGGTGVKVITLVVTVVMWHLLGGFLFEFDYNKGHFLCPNNSDTDYDIMNNM